MKAKNMLALAALAMLGLAACSNEEDVQFPDMQDTPITYTAAINELSSRASTTLTEGSFGLYLTTEGTQDSKYTAQNMEVNYENGAWNPTSQLLWKDNKSSVSYYAYMPYQRVTDPTNLLVSVEKVQANTAANDFCYASVQTATAVDNNGSINVAFDHMFAKLSVVLTYGSDISEDMVIDKVSLDNACLSGYVNLQQGALKGLVNEDIANLELQRKTNKEFQAILIPQSFDNLTVTLVDNQTNQKFQFKSSEKLKFNSGKSYQLNLIVGRDKVTMGDITVHPWESIEAGGLVTE